MVYVMDLIDYFNILDEHGQKENIEAYEVFSNDGFDLKILAFYCDVLERTIDLGHTQIEVALRMAKAYCDADIYTSMPDEAWRIEVREKSKVIFYITAYGFDANSDVIENYLRN